MNEKLKKMLEEIKNKKVSITNLVNENKLDEAMKAKKELEELQNKFDILKDVLDPDGSGAVPEPGNFVPAKDDTEKMNVFANFIKGNVKNSLKSTADDGGYTIPKDVQTKINEYRREHFSLENLVDAENVKTSKGSRVYLKKTDATGFATVEEMGKIPEVASPKFEEVNYEIEKYAGYMPVTNELVADSDANIERTMIDWLSRQDEATRNRLILDEIKKKEAVEFKSLDDIEEAIIVKLSSYEGSVVVVTNKNGLAYLNGLKNKAGDKYLRPNADVTSPMKNTLAVGTQNVPVVVVPSNVLKNDESKIPFIVGDLKEYVKIFDRQNMSVKKSDSAAVTGFNAFEQDMTILRATIRLDAEVVDEDAIVNGYVLGAITKATK